MTFEELYEMIIPLWPEEIDISDGKPTGKDGYLFANMSSINASIEEKIDYKNDHWSVIGAWSFFQALHKEAKALHAQGKTKIIVRQVSKDLINQNVRSNIEGDDWVSERNEYTN